MKAFGYIIVFLIGAIAGVLALNAWANKQMNETWKGVKPFFNNNPKTEEPVKQKEG